MDMQKATGRYVYTEFCGLLVGVYGAGADGISGLYSRGGCLLYSLVSMIVMTRRRMGERDGFLDIYTLGGYSSLV